MIDKLTQQQKERIIYVVKKENVNVWFNTQSYDNVSIMSFFILYAGRKFEHRERDFLIKFWNF